MVEKPEGMLSPYRVLDLADEKGLLCGKLLGDLGADVIKIERPGGDPTRSIGPFYHDEPDPEKSLFWFAYNTNKRGITLDIETVDGQEIFKRLVKSADIVIESFPPGYMDKLGIGYSALEKVNPGVILVSITPFGQAGPYKDYKAPDIVAWAMGGNMLARDDPDRPPVRVSHHSQAYLNAASDAVDGTMMALYHRQMTGEGQQVDVSIQESVIQATWTVTDRWDMLKDAGLHGELDFYSIRVPRVWPCKDGYIQWTYGSGAWAKQHNQAIIEWMDSEGMADDFLKKFDWDTFDLRTASQEVIDHQVESTIKFFMTHTKAELLEGAVKYRIRLYPFATTADTLENVQLNEREFWVEVEYPELGTTIIHPGAFAKASEAPLRISCRAPLIGEHNKEIYEKELGISIEELLTLKQARII